jgi:hypothetical protein
MEYRAEELLNQIRKAMGKEVGEGSNEFVADDEFDEES